MIMKKTTKEILFERMAYLNEDFTHQKPKLIIPVGISGSGKSTWINSQLDGNTEIVSPDDIRRELTGDVSDQSKNNEVFNIAFDKAINSLNANKNVIFDATNTGSYHRKQMLDNFKNKVNIEFDAYAKIFNVNPDIAKERIKKDIDSGVDRSNVPDFAIDKQFTQFKSDLNKLQSDGFEIIN